MARTRRHAARQDRPRDLHDALGGRAVRVPRRRNPAVARQGDHRYRGSRRTVFGSEPMGAFGDPDGVRPGDLRSSAAAHQADAFARTGRRTVRAAGRAGPEAQESQRDSDRRRHGGGVVRIARKSWSGGVSQPGRMHGRRAAAGCARRSRQRPSDDGREEQPGGAAADSRVD